jgi:uncharacterized repeat protein (TIGR01451 family)
MTSKRNQVLSKRSKFRRLSRALSQLALVFLIPSAAYPQAQVPPVLQAPSVYNGSLGTAPNAVAMGDFNGDGLLDFAVAEYTPNNPANGQVEIFLGNSDGSFTSKGVVPVGTIAGQQFGTNHNIGVGHFNGPNQPPGIAVAVASAPGCPNGGVTIIYAPLSAPVGNSPVTCVANATAVTSVGVGDFNADGFDDIAVSNAGGAVAGSVTVYLNAANSTSQSGFYSYASYSTPGSPLYGTLIAADFGTGTGPSLVLLANSGPFTQYFNVFMNETVTSLGVSALAFSSSLDVSTGPNGWTDLTTASFSGPGFTDIVGISEASEIRYVSVSINTLSGATTFGPLTTIAGPNGFAIVEGDFNGDGVPDFAYLDENHNLGVDLDFPSLNSSSLIKPFGPAGQGVAAGFSPALNKWILLDSGVFMGSSGSSQQIPEARSIAVYLLDPTTGQPTLAPLFAQSPTLTDSNTPPAFAVADLDGDGAPDVAVLGVDESSFAATVTPFQNVYKTSSAPGFVAQPVFDLGGGASTTGIAPAALAIAAGKFRTAILSGGLPDLALVLPDGILLLDNGGSFQFTVAAQCQGVSPGTNCYLGGDSNFPGFPFFVPQRPPILAADVNGDGIDDIVLAIPENCAASDSGGAKSRIYVLISNGDGSFKPATSYVSPVANPVALAAGKLLGSNYPDLVVVDGGDICSPASTILSSPVATAVALIPNNHDGTGTFGTPTSLLAQLLPVLPPRISSVALGDINGDGLLDIVLSAGDGLHVLLNSTAAPGTFTDQGEVPLYGPFFGGGDIIQNVAQIDVANLNAGGLPDVAAVVGGIAYIFPNNGSGSLNAPVEGYASGPNSGQMKAIDVNGDGAPDVLVSNSQGFSVVLNGAGSAANNPFAQFSAVTLPFFGVALGAPSPQVLTLTNTGATPLIISSIAYANDAGGQFATTAVLCDGVEGPSFPVTLPAGGGCLFQITFTPNALGPSAGQIVFADNSPFSNAPQTPFGNLFQHTIALTGTGIASTADVSMAVTNSPTVVPVGTPMLQYTITLMNSGPNPSTNLTFTHKLESSVMNQGAVSSQGNCTGAHSTGVTISCSLGTLSSGSTATILVDVTPTAAGNLSNPFTFTQDETDSDPMSVQDNVTVLSSLTIAIPTITESIIVSDQPFWSDLSIQEPITVNDAVFISPILPDFAPPAAYFSTAGLGFNGTPGQIQTLTMYNVGGTPLVFSGPVQITPGFTIISTICSSGATALPTSLPSGGQCSFTISYAGTSPSGTMVFTDNAALSNPPSAVSGASYTQTITLSGSGSGSGTIALPPTAVPVNISEMITVSDAPAASTPCQANVTADITVTRGPYLYSPVTHLYEQTVTLTNSGSISIPGPISLVIPGVSGNAKLFNPTGVTTCAVPGTPYVTDATLSLAPGGSTNVLLYFTDPSHAAFTYGTQVEAGSGAP